MKPLVASDAADVREYGALWSMIQAHLDRTAVTERAFARQAGLKHQTLNAWKHREPHQLPHRATHDQVARALGTPYLDVLHAALYDAGFLDTCDSPGRGDPTSVLTAEQRRVVLALVDLLGAQGP